MKLLLDTHAFLWLMYNSQKLSPLAREACQNNNNQLYLSIASVWEMQIKHQLGKLELSDSLEKMVEEECQINGLQILSIKLNHISALYNFPFYHKEPFDRILIAQTKVENAHFKLLW
jgi:PIN domain nuclease of toxin-antitoxin system